MALFVVHLILVFSSLIKLGGAFCSNPIPGFNVIASGVDITKMDLFPFGQTTLQGSRSRVISKTCNNGNKKILHNATYDYPLEVASVHTISKGQLGAKSTVYREYNQIRKDMSKAAGLSGNVGKFAFSLSASYVTMQNSIMKNEKEIIDVTSNELSHEIKLKLHRDDKFLSSHFKESLEDLEGLTYEEDTDDFKEFVEEYGTHYFESGKFGGKIRRYIETSTNYSMHVSTAALQTQAQASYNGEANRIGAAFKFDNGDASISTEFRQSSTRKSEYYGGRVNLLTANGYLNWQPTVDKNPTLLTAKLKPLYELVIDATLKKEVKTAIDEYIMRNYLEEMKRKVSNSVGKYADEITRKWLDEIKKFQDSKLLDVDEVTRLDKEIMHEFDLPRWFARDTRVCLQYYAKENGPTRCNGKTGTDKTQDCAKPNNLTKWYWDEGSRREEPACMLQWGIISTGAPEWFRQTKICLRYETNIWGRKNGTTCAPVNEFTLPFEDNTGFSKYVFNRYQFMISIPAKAPAWFKKTEFCLHWFGYGTNSRRNCKGSGPALCAVVGKWTDVYEERQEPYYSGICVMSFEWKMNHYKYVIDS